MGMPGLVYRWFFFKHSVTSLKRNVLELVGIRPVRETIIGMVETTDHRKWLTKVQALGTRLGNRKPLPRERERDSRQC